MMKTGGNYILLGNYFKLRFVLDLFMISTLINGVASDYNHSHSYEMKTLGEKRIDRTEQLYHQVNLRKENNTIVNENVLVTIAFDKMLHWIFDNEVEKADRSCSSRSFKLKLGEKFAFRRRLHFALLPIMYKMGVMTTLLTGLTVLALKGLTIGVILLIFAFGNHFTKWHKPQYQQQAQPIHVHVHSQDGHNKVTSFPSHVSGPWDRETQEPNPSSYFEDSELESYRRKFIQNSANFLKFKPLIQ